MADRGKSTSRDNNGLTKTHLCQLGSGGSAVCWGRVVASSSLSAAKWLSVGMVISHCWHKLGLGPGVWHSSLQCNQHYIMLRERSWQYQRQPFK